MATPKHLHHKTGPPRLLTVDLVVAAVEADREEFGAASTGTVMRRTGFSHQLVVQRIAEALEQGKLIRSDRVPGSLRLP